MKLPGDPWNNRWSSFYGIAWNFSMENVDAEISSSLLWDMVYKSESLGLESGIISRTLINCLKILV